MRKLFRSTCIAALTLAAINAAYAAPATTSFTPAQVNQLHTIIHDYLVANPQVLVEASKVLQAQQEKKMEASAMTGISANKVALFNNSESPSMGAKNSPATVVEFFDYQCGHCREMEPFIEKLIAQDKNVRVIFKELPIFGGMSTDAAKAALAANMQPGKYYMFHNLLLTSAGGLTKDKIMDLAQKAGLDMSTLKKDMASPVVDKQIRDNFQLAQALKIMGTPTFVITNKAETKFAYIPGATTLADLQAKIATVQK
ncbi:MAG: DsbA family protein [Gammaproteobacteria bacterium]|nr:DsbA family protein [Gammaproteobacteria bacterium]